MAWVNENFEGPVSADQLIGHHIGEFLSRGEAEKINDLINTALSRGIPLHGEITLDMDFMHKTRKTRILPNGKTTALIFIIKYQ